MQPYGAYALGPSPPQGPLNMRLAHRVIGQIPANSPLEGVEQIPGVHFTAARHLPNVRRPWRIAGFENAPPSTEELAVP